MSTTGSASLGSKSTVSPVGETDMDMLLESVQQRTSTDRSHRPRKQSTVLSRGLTLVFVTCCDLIVMRCLRAYLFERLLRVESDALLWCLKLMFRGFWWCVAFIS